MSETLELPPWWGYSRDHGWVVIDRTIPPNKSGLSQDILYCRCSDSMTVIDKRSRWRAPLYVYASTYIGSLASPESEKAAQEYATFKSRWAEFQAEIRRQYDFSEAKRHQQEQERIQLEETKKGLKAKRRTHKADTGSGSEAQAQDA
jgi:hypothetical protein